MVPFQFCSTIGQSFLPNLKVISEYVHTDAFSSQCTSCLSSQRYFGQLTMASIRFCKAQLGSAQVLAGGKPPTGHNKFYCSQPVCRNCLSLRDNVDIRQRESALSRMCVCQQCTKTTVDNAHMYA